jgi:hypothetical protein
MKKTTVAAIAILMLFGSTAAFSQFDTTPAEDNLFQFLSESFTPENRIELTRRIDVYCRDVLDTVPTNTPAEEAWVMSEFKSVGRDTDRVNRLLSSKEWARYQLKDTFSECLQQVALLRQAQTQKARSAEAEHFISLAYTFNQDRDLGAFAKLVSPRAGVSAVAINTFRQLTMVAAMRTLNGRIDPIFPKSAQSR